MQMPTQPRKVREHAFVMYSTYAHSHALIRKSYIAPAPVQHAYLIIINARAMLEAELCVPMRMQ